MSDEPIIVTSCRFLVCGSNSENLQSFANLIRNQELRNIHFEHKATTASALSEAITKTRPDIVYMDYDAIPDESLQVVNALRFGYTGRNPYLPVIFSSCYHPSTLKMALSCGVDMFLPSPFTFEDLSRQILAITDCRPLFVASHDYIGPQRNATHSLPSVFSSNQRQAVDHPFSVPNVFALKARGEKVSPEQESAMIKSANSRVNTEIIRKRSYIIHELIGNLHHLEDETLFLNAEEAKTINLQRLFDNALISKTRLRNTQFTHIADMYNSLMEVIRSIQKGKLTFNSRQITLMQQTASGIIQAFSSDANTVQQASNITSTLQQYTNAVTKSNAEVIPDTANASSSPVF